MPGVHTTEVHETAVARLWDGQRTPRQVAAAIGGMTPYEVGVIVRRLGLDAPQPAVATPQPEPVSEPAADPIACPIAEQPPVEALAAERGTARSRAEARAPGERPRTLLELHHDDCRWPIGDPLAESFRYCGGARSRGSYCAWHAALAYQLGR